MRKLLPIVPFMGVLLAACGGGTKTVTVGSGPGVSQTSPTTQTQPSSTTSTPGLTTVTGPVTIQKIHDCLQGTGAQVEPPTKLGAGKGVFAIMPNGTNIGVAQAPNITVANQLAQLFAARPGYHVNRTSDPELLVVVKGRQDPSDLSKVSTCVAQ